MCGWKKGNELKEGALVFYFVYGGSLLFFLVINLWACLTVTMNKLPLDVKRNASVFSGLFKSLLLLHCTCEVSAGDLRK